MAGVGIQVQVKDQAAQAAFATLLARGQALPMADIGMELVNSTQQRFLDQHGPGGQTWPAHAKSTLARKKAPGRDGSNPLLIATGLLLQSITYQAGDDQVEVGTNRVYGRIHQLGGKAGRGQAITIPARPYLGVDAEDEAAITRLLTEYLGEAVP